MENLTFLINCLSVALGIGFVIFIHELGHFALAKWNGVKVERFSIGFGPSLLKFRRGETEYVLAALPLGGYVKMLGEERDDQSDAPQDDPRAFVNKSVGARMSIMVAGVVMNMLFGLASFALVYARGVEETPTRVGDVSAGSPAYEAGILPGDEIVAIDGVRDLNYNQMRFKVVLSGAGQKLQFTIKRPGVADEFPVEVEPKRDPNSPTPTIGVLSDQSLLLMPISPFLAPPGVGEPKGTEGGFQAWDKVVAVGPVGTEPIKVADSLELHRVLAANRDKPLEFVIERTLATGETPSLMTPPTGPARTVKIVVPPHPFQDFGLRMTPGPVTSIQKNSPAQKAGFLVGDKIVGAEGMSDFDPMALPDWLYDRAGSKVKLEVMRGGERKMIEVTPDRSPVWVEDLRRQPSPTPDALKLPGIGLALTIEPTVLSIQPDSPAARAGLQPGQTLASLTVTFPPLEEDPDKPAKVKPEPRKETFKFEANGTGWPTIYALLQMDQALSIEARLKDKAEPISLQTATVPNRFHSLRGLNFQRLSRQLPPQGFTASIRRGWDDTVENVMSIYLMLRGLFQRRVGTQAVGGVFRVGSMAYNQARAGLTPFLQFLGMLSINLAVLNFLPIPPLDGGQMVFLIGEKVRGRPLPDWFIRSMFITGLIFVIALMLFANIQDIVIMIQDYFK